MFISSVWDFQFSEKKTATGVVLNVQTIFSVPLHCLRWVNNACFPLKNSHSCRLPVGRMNVVPTCSGELSETAFESWRLMPVARTCPGTAKSRFVVRLLLEDILQPVDEKDLAPPETSSIYFCELLQTDPQKSRPDILPKWDVKIKCWINLFIPLHLVYAARIRLDWFNGGTGWTLRDYHRGRKGISFLQ